MCIAVHHHPALRHQRVEYQGIAQVGGGGPQLQIDDLLEHGRSVHMQFLLPAHQVHGTDQALQTEVVVAVEVTDENVADAEEVDAGRTQTFLGAFATIHEVQGLVNVDELRRGITSTGGQGGTRAQGHHLKSSVAHLRNEKPPPWYERRMGV
jgi:hypothetical protein